MNIIIFGCRKITVDVIKYIKLHYAQHTISLVINHDEERDRIYDSELVQDCCNTFNIPTIKFEDGHKIDAEIIKKYCPDIVFSFYYRRILAQTILDIPHMGCINIHPAILPKGKGPAPSLWQILQGDTKAGVTIHYMVSEVDSGDIIDQTIINIGERTGFELNRDLMEIGFELFKCNFDSIIFGTNKSIPQDPIEATYCLPFSKSLRYIYWDDPNKILRQLRAFARPYDGAISRTSSDLIVKFWKGQKLAIRNSLKPPGCWEIIDGNLLVQTCTMPILFTDWDLVNSNNTLKSTGRFVSGPPVAC